MLEFELPWPPRELSPNCAIHWQAKMSHKKRYRDICKSIVREVGITIPFDGNLHLRMTFHPPTKRPFDLDNCLARMKAGIDGAADALDINDVRFRPITIDMGEPIKNGKVIMEILL